MSLKHPVKRLFSPFNTPVGPGIVFPVPTSRKAVMTTEEITEGKTRFLIGRVEAVLHDHPSWTVKDLREKDNTGLHNELLDYLHKDKEPSDAFYHGVWSKKKLTDVLQTLKDKLKEHYNKNK